MDGPAHRRRDIWVFSEDMEQELGLAIQNESLSKLSACQSVPLYKQEEEQTVLSWERGTVCAVLRGLRCWKYNVHMLLSDVGRSCCDTEGRLQGHVASCETRCR